MLQRLLLAAVGKAQRGFGHRMGQHLEADFGDQPQRAPTACHQPRYVISGHVFHDLAAIAQHLALAVDHLQPQHKVAHGPHIGAGGAGQARSHHAAHGAVRAKVRWLERQALALGGQRGFQLGQRCACQHGDDQLAGFVADDASERAGVQQLALQLQAIEVLAATAANAQRGLVMGGGANALAEGCGVACG